MKNIAFATNEGRSKHLSEALFKQNNNLDIFEFDDIDIVTKYVAAALSFKHPRSEWWGNYQMHPLIQRRRSNNLQKSMRTSSTYDALLMWGSWFNPFPGSKKSIPYYLYIDQSRSLLPTKDEPTTSTRGRKKSYDLQVKTYENCSAIFCMSRWAYNQTMESHPYLSPDKVHVVGWGPCGIDLAKEPLETAERKPTVLHVSSDFQRKGVDFLLETASILYATNPEIKFTVIGEDSRFTPSDYTPNVDFKGRITDRLELEKQFRESNIFFLPHRFDRNPHVLVEAMGAGLPIVASKQGGAIEVIENEQTGILCDIGNCQQYAKAILSIVENKETWNVMANKGKNLANSFYNWDAVASRILERIGRQ